MPVSTRPEIKRRSRQFFRLLSESFREKRVGETHVPKPATGNDMALTFIGHAGFLLELDGQRLLIDPNFANWLILVRRLRRPGIAVGSLPPIDWVLITHAHMDHLNRPSLRQIIGQSRAITGEAPGVVLPRGNADLVRDLGFSRTVELDRWGSFATDHLTITHTPARHWGARVITDTHRGFGGYMIEGAGHSIYHAGDTAYFEGFHEISRRLRPRLALLPIGAYSPEGFRTVHASPEDSLQAFLDLGADTLIPMHYGTFRLSHEPMEEPVPRLLEEARRLGIEDRMCVLREGVTKFFPAAPDAVTELAPAEILERAG